MTKRTVFLFMIILIYFAGCKMSKPVAGKSNQEKKAPESSASISAVDFSKPATWILGYFNPARLRDEPYSVWYLKGYDDYQINTEAINNLLDISKDGIKIKVVMGTWCPDSRREVPRFMRVLDAWQFPMTDVTFIGVDDSKNSPVGEYTTLNILRVPTFIIYKNNIEAGRIIENPVASLEQDMVKILQGMNNNK